MLTTFLRDMLILELDVKYFVADLVSPTAYGGSLIESGKAGSVYALTLFEIRNCTIFYIQHCKTIFFIYLLRHDSILKYSVGIGMY